MGQGIRFPEVSELPASPFVAELLKPSGTDYRPTYTVLRGPKAGGVHRVWSRTARRPLQLMSTLEMPCWLEADSLPETTDVREQFAFGTVDEFQDIARSLGYHPPRYD